MKKFLSVLLLISILFTICACSTQKSNKSEKELQLLNTGKDAIELHLKNKYAIDSIELHNIEVIRQYGEDDTADQSLLPLVFANFVIDNNEYSACARIADNAVVYDNYEHDKIVDEISKYIEENMGEKANEEEILVYDMFANSYDMYYQVYRNSARLDLINEKFTTAEDFFDKVSDEELGLKIEITSTYRNAKHLNEEFITKTLSKSSSCIMYNMSDIPEDANYANFLPNPIRYIYEVMDFCRVGKDWDSYNSYFYGYSKVNLQSNGEITAINYINPNKEISLTTAEIPIGTAINDTYKTLISAYEVMGSCEFYVPVKYVQQDNSFIVYFDIDNEGKVCNFQVGNMIYETDVVKTEKNEYIIVNKSSMDVKQKYWTIAEKISSIPIDNE